jgi:hypothetical protein
LFDGLEGSRERPRSGGRDRGIRDRRREHGAGRPCDLTKGEAGCEERCGTAAEHRQLL